MLYRSRSSGEAGSPPAQRRGASDRIRCGLSRGLLAVVQLSFIASTVLVGSTAVAGPVSAAAVTVIHELGANDEFGQKDLTLLTVDNAGLPTSLLVKWNWDETSTFGANTLDGCALFDTDADGFVDFAVCDTASGGPPLQLATSVYSCTDNKSDRCTGPTLLSGKASACTVAVTTDDPFDASFPDGPGDSCPADTKATCSIILADVGASAASLVNVSRIRRRNRTLTPPTVS